MNNCDLAVLKEIVRDSPLTQREVSERTSFSLGAVNKALGHLREAGLLSLDGSITSAGVQFINQHSPKRAVILAAGFGMRMVPINLETPKALLEIKGGVLIERQIRFLHEAGIHEIYVVVGFMKEAFEYLIDEYGVQLIVNSDYSFKNNLHSLYLAKEHLDNCYIIPSDIWLEKNPFDKHEVYSWYMVSDLMDPESPVHVGKSRELLKTKKGSNGNAMIGIAYITHDVKNQFINNLVRFDNDSAYNESFWEECLYDGDRMCVAAKLVRSNVAIEINTYEQLREIDENSSQLQNDAIHIIEEALGVYNRDITDIKVLKKGMTNRSFLFSCKGKKYIMRIPGEGTDMLINRKEEASVYGVIKDKSICDNLVYINPNNGYKITEYFNDSRNCDPLNFQEVKQCMARLRSFHEMKLKVDHTFDIFKQLEFYETLWKGARSIFRDYAATKEKVYELKKYIDLHAKPYSLAHIDAVCDNFLFVKIDGKEQIRLIDWEYAGMQDPDVDLAMNCIYALYNREQVDQLIDCYYTEGCSKETRIKIYCYIAACGLLWSNWCEYKRALGVEFGEYALRQYRYAKEYYKIVQEELARD